MKLRFTASVLLIAVITMPAPSFLMAGDDAWPQFRGQAGHGLAAGATPPLRWSETNNIMWKVPVPGHGRSSPVLMGGKIWLTICTEKNVERKRIGPDDMQAASHVSLGAACFDKTDGKCLWQATLFDIDNPAPVHWLNSWATPTPVVESGRLYCDFGTFGTACLDAGKGTILWKKQLPLDHQVGPGSSPVLFKDLLILVRDGRDAQYVAALNKNTGETLWKTNRPPITADSGDFKKAFVTPLIINGGGKTQMIIPGAQWVVSYDPSSGQEIWRVKHGQGFSLASVPLFGRDIAYICSGCMKPEILALRVDGNGDVTSTNVLWRLKGAIPVMSSPILVDDLLYCVSDNGVVSCFDAKTGTVCWRKQITGNYMASPVSAAGRLYFFNQRGKATVLKAGKEPEVLAESNLEIEGELAATPALAGKSIIIRTDTHLYRIEEK